MSFSEAQKARAARFSAMHHQSGMFVLPNIWNVGSAHVFARQGFAAVATSSAGIAYDMGRPDGEDITFADLLDMVGRISARIEIPLSVDFERGYAETGEAVKENARQLLLAGAVGFNIEDGQADGTLSSLDVQREKIAALAELKRETGVDFVINARTCAYWLDVAGEDEKLQIAIERGEAFARAGADCVFVPGALDRETVATLVRSIRLPLNIILNRKSGELKDIERSGVRRLSVGSAPVRLVYHETIKAADDLKAGRVQAMLDNPFSYADANHYFGG